MTRYDIVLMDADDTLFDYPKAAENAFYETIARHGIPRTDGILARYQAINQEMWRKNERGEIGKDELAIQRFVAFFAAENLQRDPVRFNADYLSALSHQSQMLNGAEELCAALSQQARIYIATNGFAAAQRGRLAGSAIAPYISGMYISEEMGVEKPSLAYFEAVFADLDITDRSRVLMVGDSLTSDMPGGIRAGIDTCWYNPKGKPCTLEGITYEIHELSEFIPKVME